MTLANGQSTTYPGRSVVALVSRLSEWGWTYAVNSRRNADLTTLPSHRTAHELEICRLRGTRTHITPASVVISTR